MPHHHRYLAIIVAFLTAAAASAQTSAPTAATTPADLLAELAARRAALKEDDHQGRLDLALWCRHNSLWQPMSELAREVLERVPDSRQAFNLLLEYDQRVPLPADDDWQTRQAAQFKEHFNHEFRIRTTAHFAIFHDTADAFAAARAAELEKAYGAFMFYFNLRTIHPQLLARRLPMVLFAQRSDFLAYAKQADGADMPWAAGYFSQRTNFSAFYDDTTSRTADKLDAVLETYRTRAADLAAQIETVSRTDAVKARTLAAERAVLLGQITRAKAEFAVQAVLHNNSKTLHESVHQLAFNTGIQTRMVDYPLWLSEGLACAFEVPDSAGRLGPALPNLGRSGILKAAIRDKALISLEKLIAESPPRDVDENTLAVWYAESWALFTFVYKLERPKLEAYLLAYGQLPIARPISDLRRKKLFTDAFGEDLAALERRFIAYARSLPGPVPAPAK